MATIYYKISYSGALIGSGDPDAKLFIGDLAVTSRYINGHGATTPPLPFLYFEKTIVQATYSKPFDYETATTEIDHHGIDHSPVRLWFSINVPDDFVIPWELTPDLLPGIFTRTPDDDGFAGGGFTLPDIKDLPGLIWDGISSTVLRFGPGRGLQDIQKALDNAQVVKDTVEETLNKGFGLLDDGFRMISDPDADPGKFDAAVNKYLNNTLQNHIKALEDVQTFDDPNAERVFDTIVKGIGVIVSVESGNPGDPDAGYAIEVQTGADSGGPWLRGRDGADIILAGAGGSLMDAGKGNDILIGGLGFDFADGGSGSDRVYTGDGDDNIGLDPSGRLAGDVDFIDGGAGIDTLVLYSTSAGNAALPSGGFVLNIASREVFAGDTSWATFVSVEEFYLYSGWSVIGSDRDDVIHGEGDGQVSIDTIFVEAGAGNDKVTGEAGVFDGGLGHDFFGFTAWIDRAELDLVTIDLAADSVTAPGFSFNLVLDGFEEFSAFYQAHVQWLGTTQSEVFHIIGDQYVDGRGGGDTIVTNGRVDMMAGFGVDILDNDFTFSNIANLRGTDDDNIFRGDNEANVLSGEGGDDSLSGEGGDDILIGGAGKDSLEGGRGSDTYIVDSDDSVSEFAPYEGTDTVRSLANYVLGANAAVEVLSAYDTTATTAMKLTGNAFAQTIIGNAGANSLSDGGGFGVDTLRGLGGDDNYFIGNSGAVIVEAAGGGSDTVRSSVNYALKAGVQVEVLRTDLDTGTNTINLTGNALKQTIVGNAGANVIVDGGGDADRLSGLGGHDTYWIGNSAAVIVEAAGGGSDTVRSSVDYTLKAGVEVEMMRTNADAGTAAINLTGNALKQTIVGNAGANILADGGGAADKLNGLGGDDVYRIGNSAAVIVEAVAGGSDTVKSSVDYVLKAGVEVEQLTTNTSAGTTAINLTGNALAQLIVGNAGANILSDGGGAADRLNGLGGDDTYRIGNSAAIIGEAAGGGTDTVRSSVDYVLKAGVEVEELRADNNAATTDVDLTGNEIAQTLRGNAGSNILDGKGGNDVLRGFGGEDFFVFSIALDANNVDTITDFSAVDDIIRLENAIFTRLTVTGALTAGRFRSNADGVAVDGNDFVLYDNTDGKLYYDADGSGAGARVHLATLTGAPAITAPDFVVI